MKEREISQNNRRRAEKKRRGLKKKKKKINGQKEKTSEISSRRFPGHPALLVTKQRNGFLRVHHFLPLGLASSLLSLWLGLVGRQQGALGSHPMAQAPAPGSSAKDELSQRSHTASQRCHPAPISRRAGIRVEVMLGDTGHDTRGLGHTPTHNLGLCYNLKLSYTSERRNWVPWEAYKWNLKEDVVFKFFMDICIIGQCFSSILKYIYMQTEQKIKC